MQRKVLTPTLEMQENPTMYENKQTNAINISLWGLKERGIIYTIVRLILPTKHLPQVFRKFVNHSCNEALHGTELRVQPKEHQHEEEEAGP